MSTLEHNPPAFPVEIGYGLEPGEAMQTGERVAQFPGMTLRDWFAGQSLTTICAAGLSPLPEPDLCAFWAYRLADAMLVQRQKDD